MKWFYNLKTAVKLISAFIIVAIIVGVVGLFGLNNLSKLNDSLTDMYERRVTGVDQASSLQIIFQRMRVNMMNLHLAGTKEEEDTYLTRIQEFEKELEDGIAAYNREFALAEHEQLYKEVVSSFQSFKNAFNQTLQLSLSGNDQEFLSALHGEYKTIREKFNGDLDALIELNKREASDANEAGNVLYALSRTTTITVIVAAIVLSIGLGYFVSQIIVRPLNRMVGLMGNVANGDLREVSNIDTKDEIGILAKSINEMVLSLRKTVSNIIAAAESVSAASQQISASTEEIAGSSNSQASSAQTMNELFKELSTAINSVAHSAEQASELSNKTLSVAQDGTKVVDTSIDGMSRVNQQMSKLEEDSNRIGEIIEVIDEIADQTNLLALNAAIEAARAGDQGRGFAVVADEVRKLAERSSEATKQITTIIKGMQENTLQCADAVTEGVVLSQKTGEAFELIVSMVNDSANKVTEIAAASEEQAAQSSEVLSAIESISAATEEAAASSEETASAAQSLAQLAENLNSSVSTFKIN